jgi:GT2 family glycosyltransferase
MDTAMVRRNAETAFASEGPLPSVSVVIPHYNDFENLARCLESLRQQTYSWECFEVVVADNNSEDGVARIKRMARDVRVVAADEQGAGPARNAGAAAARGSRLAFIDSDCIADKNWLQEGISALAGFDYAGGQVITKVRNPECVTPAEGYEAVFGFEPKKYIEKNKFSVTASLFVPVTVFERVGGFRSGVSEDVDWCHRANSMGFRLGYAERAIVRHPARWQWAALKRKWDRILVESLRLERERPGWQLRWLGHAIAVAGSPLVHWVSVIRSPRLVGLRAKLSGVIGLLRVRWYRSYRMMWLLVRTPH